MVQIWVGMISFLLPTAFLLHRLVKPRGAPYDLRHVEFQRIDEGLP
jgi:hypothetical protein